MWIEITDETMIVAGLAMIATFLFGYFFSKNDDSPGNHYY